MKEEGLLSMAEADRKESIRSRTGGILLCGGQGRRLGGAEKGLLLLHGRPLCLHGVERLRPQVSWLAISANREWERYASLGLPVLRDLRLGFVGPLAGIEAALAALPPGLSLLLTAPGDAPFLPADLGRRLFQGVKTARSKAAYAHDGAQGQFLCALFDRECEATLRSFLDRGGRSVQEFLRSIGAAAVDFSECAADFWNVNTPKDWERIACRPGEARVEP